tara:strand:+ start:694 stop:1005 length:312 start_codon:yes stop_codon:yes gene_type:complete
MGQEKELNTSSRFSLTVKEMIAATIGLSSLLGVYFTLQADIATAMQEPKPEVQKIEFDYKDQLIRATIEQIQLDVGTVREDVREIKEHLDKMDERLYQISRQQ